MSEAQATGSRPGVFSRIFNALVGDAAPEGVDPALHRRALWWAFSICAWVYSIRFLLGLPTYSMSLNSFLAENHRWFLVVLSRLPHVGPPQLFAALLIPVFIYAIVLKRNGARLPLAAVEVAGISLVAYVITKTILYLTFSLTMGLVALLILLLVRRHLHARVTSLLLGITLILFLLYDAFSAAIVLDSMEVWRFEWFSGYSMAITSGIIYSILWLPLAVALPISLLAHAATPALPSRAKRSWNLLWVFLLTVAVVIACIQAPYTVKVYVLPNSLSWMVTALLLVVILWLYKTGRGSRELLAYLILSLAAIVVFLVTTNYTYRIPIALAIGGATALMLTTDATAARVRALAIGSLVFNAVATGLWHRFVIGDLIRLRTIWFTGPEGYGKGLNPMLTLKLACAHLILLAIITGALLLAWWFVKLREIEALLPWGRDGSEGR